MENVSHFRRIVELSSEAIFVLNKDFVVEYANSSAVIMIGEKLDDIIGTDFREYLRHQKDVINFLEQQYIDEVTSNRISCYSKEIVEFGKRVQNVVEICMSKAMEGDKEVKTYVYVKAITEEKKLQEELKQANEFLTNLIQHSADGIIAADMKGKIIIYNESAEKLLGYTADEALENVHITQIYKPGVAKDVMKAMRSNNYGIVGKMAAKEWIAINKYGEEIPCRISAALIYDRDGNEVASVGIFSDLRERKRMEKELYETHLKLVQSEKMSSLGKLAAGIAHEINNPLGGIIMFSEMILEEMSQKDENRDDIKRIVSEAVRCKNIVKGLLEFSRQTDYSMTLVDVNRLLEQGMLLLENQALFHNIKIIRDMDQSLPLVKCDSARLSQVFINITLNAVDAMGKRGTFTIRTKYKEKSKKIEIVFTDTGCGIQEEIMPRIFDPFFTTKDVGKGTGLGLSVSYGIIKDHGGIIDIRSKLGEGTTFIIKLPTGE